MSTGCAPVDLVAGGRRYFDALVDQVDEERRNGWVIEEMLATLIEVNWAQYRALVALTGSRDLPRQIRVPRPADAAKRPERIDAKELQRRLREMNGEMNGG